MNRLPRSLRRQAHMLGLARERRAVPTTPHERFEAVMNSGAPIVDNASERLYAIGELEPDRCPECDGDGWFTETVEGSNGRDEDVDWPCQACDQTGVAS